MIVVCFVSVLLGVVGGGGGGHVGGSGGGGRGGGGLNDPLPSEIGGVEDNVNKSPITELNQTSYLTNDPLPPETGGVENNGTTANKSYVTELNQTSYWDNGTTANTSYVTDLNQTSYRDNDLITEDYNHYQGAQNSTQLVDTSHHGLSSVRPTPPINETNVRNNTEASDKVVGEVDEGRRDVRRDALTSFRALDAQEVTTLPSVQSKLNGKDRSETSSLAVPNLTKSTNMKTVDISAILGKKRAQKLKPEPLPDTRNQHRSLSGTSHISQTPAAETLDPMRLIKTTRTAGITRLEPATISPPAMERSPEIGADDGPESEHVSMTTGVTFGPGGGTLGEGVTATGTTAVTSVNKDADGDSDDNPPKAPPSSPLPHLPHLLTPSPVLHLTPLSPHHKDDADRSFTGRVDPSVPPQGPYYPCVCRYLFFPFFLIIISLLRRYEILQCTRFL